MDRRDAHDSSIFAVPGQLILDLGGKIEGHLDAMQLAQDAALDAYCLVVVAEAAPAPDSKQRDRMQPYLDTILKQTQATAIVIQGGGIHATTKRTLVRVMASLAHSRKPFRVFSQLEAALVWLREEAQSNGHDAFSREELPTNLGGVFVSEAG
jgi:hypothetical protein